MVEDSAGLRRVLTRQLTAAGYRVLAVENARAAIEQIETPEVIPLPLTDIVMPGGMNGHELARVAVQLRPNLKTLLTTGFSDMAGRRCGAVEHPHSAQAISQGRAVASGTRRAERVTRLLLHCRMRVPDRPPCCDAVTAFHTMVEGARSSIIANGSVMTAAVEIRRQLQGRANVAGSRCMILSRIGQGNDVASDKLPQRIVLLCVQNGVELSYRHWRYGQDCFRNRISFLYRKYDGSPGSASVAHQQAISAHLTRVEISPQTSRQPPHRGGRIALPLAGIVLGA